MIPPNPLPLSDFDLDAQGLRCPLPILRSKKALSALHTGQILKILTTDAGAAHDFEAFCRQTGHLLLGQIQEGGVTQHWIRKK